MSRSDRLKNIKVGIAAIASLVLLGLAYWMVGNIAMGGKTYPLSVVFPSVSGVDVGTPVQMAGVEIGAVDLIELTPANRALVVLKVKEGRRIPRGSQVRIASVSMLGDKYIEVLPGPSSAPDLKPGSTLVGIPPFNLEDLLPQVSRVLERVDSVGASVQDLVSDQSIRGNLAKAMSNANLAAAAGLQLVSNLQMMVRSNQDEVNTITSNLAAASADIARAAARADELMAGARREDVTQVMADLKSATRSLDEAAANAAALTGDPDLRDDLKATIRNTREAAEEARDIVGRIGEMVGLRRSGRSEPRPRVQPPGGKGASVDFLYDADRGKSRVDANVAFTTGGRHFYRAGIFDIGEDARVNLQMGRNVGPDRSFRWGLYQSRIGLGYDWQADSKLFLQSDLYWPNDPRVDVKARYDLMEGLGGWLGFEGIGSGETRPMAGVQFRF